MWLECLPLKKKENHEKRKKRLWSLISIFLRNMFVFMLIELENRKILQAGCFWSWQIKEEGKLSSIDISGQLLTQCVSICAQYMPFKPFLNSIISILDTHMTSYRRKVGLSWCFRQWATAPCPSTLVFLYNIYSISERWTKKSLKKVYYRSHLQLLLYYSYCITK